MIQIGIAICYVYVAESLLVGRNFVSGICNVKTFKPKKLKKTYLFLLAAICAWSLNCVVGGAENSTYE